MKIIFLDIDGVVNTIDHISLRFKRPAEHRGTHEEWCPIACSYINAVGEVVPGEVGIVVSSSWRVGRTNKEMRSLLRRNNITLPYYGATEFLGWNPRRERPIRGQEIKKFTDLLADTLAGYVILDDDQDMLPEQEPHFVRCDTKAGFSDTKKVNQAIKILSQ